VQVSIAWLKDRPKAYRTLCKLWASEEFIAKSHRAWDCRGTDGPPAHTYVPYGHVGTSQRMVRKIVTKNVFTLCFFLLTCTHRSMQVVNGRLIWKCGIGVTGEVTIQTLTSCAIQWPKFGWWVIDKLFLHMHYYRCCHVYNLFLLAEKNIRKKWWKNMAKASIMRRIPLTVGSSMIAETEKHTDDEIDALFSLTLRMWDMVPLIIVDCLFLKVCSIRWGTRLQGGNITEAKFVILF
jgi:hypothetical protein